MVMGSENQVGVLLDLLFLEHLVIEWRLRRHESNLKLGRLTSDIDLK